MKKTINSDEKDEKGKKKIMKLYNTIYKDGVVYSIKELKEEYKLNDRDAKILHFLLKQNLKKQKSYKFAE